MVFLGRMNREHFGKLRQPFREVTLELSHPVRIALSLSVKNDDCTQAIPDTITNKPEYLPACLLDSHAMQIQPCFDRVLPQSEFAKNPMLNTRALPAQYVVRR